MRWIPWIAFVAAALLLLAWSLCRISARSDQVHDDPLGSKREPWKGEAVKLLLFFLALSALMLFLPALSCAGLVRLGIG